MKIARRTKQVIASVKADATEIKHNMELLVARLSEHPGTKRISSKLERVISQLDDWQKVA